MDGTDYRFNLNSRLRLRDGVDPNFYSGLSTLGNEGWVRHHRKDRYGLPEIYIEWDRNHWTYNGAPNRWTYEDHFDLIEDNMPSKKDQATELATSFATQLAALFGDDSESSSEAPSELDQARQRMLDAQRELSALEGDEPEHGDVDAAYAQAVEEAKEALEGAEGFLLIKVERQMHPKMPGGVLVPEVTGFSRSPEGEIVIHANLGQLAARHHQELAVQAITSLRSPDA